MDSRIVYRRTPKGEQEVSLRTLPHAPWLTLVMVDGRATVGDLIAMKPELPDVVPSLDRLHREGFIEPLQPEATSHQTAQATELDSLPMAWALRDEPPVKDDSAAAAAWVRRGMLLLPVVLLGAVILYGYRSLDAFRAQVESALAQDSAAPSIGDVSFTLSPWPVLKLSNVKIGKTFKAGEVLAHPPMAALLGRPGPIARLEVRSATLSGLDVLALLVGPTTHAAENRFVAERITLNASTIEAGSLVLAPLTGDLQYGSNGQLEEAVLRVDEGKAQAIVRREDGELAIEFSARNWSTPTDPAVTFERLDASGTLDGEHIVLSRVAGLLHDGVIKGELTFAWGPSLVAEGRFSATHLDVQGLIARFTRDFSIAGRLEAEGDFSARGKSLEVLLKDANVDATFRLRGGVIHNADVLTATRDGTTGGSTQFEELSGTLQTAGRAFSFRQLELGSGLMTAKGALDITPSRQIVGRFTIRPKTHGQPGGTVVVGGSLKEPTLRPGS